MVDFHVSINPDNAEVLVWPSALDNESFARRKPGGSWRFGVSAVPTAYELNDDFERVLDSNLAAILVHEARAAYSSAKPTLLKAAALAGS